MSKVITEENLKTIEILNDVLSEEINSKDVFAKIFNGESRIPEVIKRLLKKGESFCFENEGDLPYLESPYNWELRMPNKKITYKFNRFDLPISFKSALKYLDDYTQTGFDFYIQHNSNEYLHMLVDDLKFEKDSNEKRIFTAHYVNEENNTDCYLIVEVNDIHFLYKLQGKVDNLKNVYYCKFKKLTEEIKDKYGIEVPQLPLPY